jgi:hypothetical protein
VKFHISTLLSKFGVETRTELARRAAGFISPATLDAEPTAVESSSGNQRNLRLEAVPAKRPLQMANKGNSVRFPGRVLMA